MSIFELNVLDSNLDKNRKTHKKKLHKNAMTKPHKFEVNSTKSRSLTHFEFLLDNKWSMSINKILFKTSGWDNVDAQRHKPLVLHDGW